MNTQENKPPDLRLFESNTQNLTAEEQCTCRTASTLPCKALQPLPAYSERKYPRRVRRVLAAQNRRGK